MYRMIQAISVLLAIASLTMWARSEFFWYDSAWVWFRSDQRLMLKSHRGVLACYIQDENGSWERGDGPFVAKWSLEPQAEVAWDERSFHLGYGDFTIGTESFLADEYMTLIGFTVPYWFISLALVIFPLIHVILGVHRLQRDRPTTSRISSPA